MEQNKKNSLWEKLNGIKIYELGLPLYLVIFALVFAAMLLGWLPGGMLGAFLVMMVFGGLLTFILRDILQKRLVLRTDIPISTMKR